MESSRFLEKSSFMVFWKAGIDGTNLTSDGEGDVLAGGSHSRKNRLPGFCQMEVFSK